MGPLSKTKYLFWLTNPKCFYKRLLYSHLFMTWEVFMYETFDTVVFVVQWTLVVYHFVLHERHHKWSRPWSKAMVTLFCIIFHDIYSTSKLTSTWQTCSFNRNFGHMNKFAKFSCRQYVKNRNIAIISSCQFKPICSKSISSGWARWKFITKKGAKAITVFLLC